MEQKDIEIKLQLLEEKQLIQEAHIKDVDICCGKIQGHTESMIQNLRERVIGIEHDMDDNCHEVELEQRANAEQIKSLWERNKELREEIDSIHVAYRNATLGILTSLAVALVSLILH
ncbi:MAG: hypothetical protein BZ138_05955 [Methanosphaera sp. rholeuAM270]|nr:MAG: hypothetical protein BZ138_05955 [Methanosphaera sp. rholeuAM270]